MHTQYWEKVSQMRCHSAYSVLGEGITDEVSQCILSTGIRYHSVTVHTQYWEKVSQMRCHSAYSVLG